MFFVCTKSTDCMFLKRVLTQAFWWRKPKKQEHNLGKVGFNLLGNAKRKEFRVEKPENLHTHIRTHTFLDILLFIYTNATPAGLQLNVVVVVEYCRCCYCWSTAGHKK